jgi:hypothetical protein
MSGALHVAARIGAGLFGSYALVWGFVSLGIVLAVAAGMPFGEAQTLLYLLAFPVLLGCFCWAFAASSLARVWVVFGGGSVLMTGAAWLVSQALL